jgi:hypothetical protein
VALSHGVFHHLRMAGPPIALLDAEKLAAAKADFIKMVEGEVIIRWSSSPLASPLHLVKKPDGSWWPCGDFADSTSDYSRQLPSSQYDDFSARVTGCKQISKIHLRKGYFQIFMHPDDIPKTAIIIPFGLFEFLPLPFGIRNAG